MNKRNGQVASQVVISSCCALLCATLCVNQANGQGRGGADWTTSGNDAQRSAWVRSDPKISKAGMEKPGFAFLWKQKLANEPRQLNSLMPTVLMDRYIGYRGFRSLGYVGGSSDNIIALDTDLGRIEWKKRLEGAPPPASPTPACPGGMTTALTRPTSTAIAPPPTAGGGGGRGGRGGPAKSGVGEPGQGAITIPPPVAAAPDAGRGNVPGAALGAGGAGRRGGGGGGVGRLPQLVYALSSDGKLHSMYVSNGEEPTAAISFLPANANASGLIVIDNVAYAATSNGCGTAPNGVWALDIASKQVTSWKSNGSVVGSAGPSFGPDGTIFAATDAGELVSLEPKTLKVVATYNSGGSGFVSSPMIFEYKEKPLVAIASKDGRLHLLPSTLGTATFKTPAPASATELAASGLATWQDSDGTRWVLAPAASSVVAWKVVDENGAPALQQGWSSRELVSPLPPMVINGVVFAVSSGEFRSKDAKTTAQKSTHAVLYAMDARNGKELWSSGNTITSFIHSGGLSGGGSQMYLQTHDGTLYAFGFPIEH